MSEKIIIKNETNKSMNEVLEYIKVVIEKGRISNYGKNYCYATQFNDGLMVYADRNKESDTFTLREYKKLEVIL